MLQARVERLARDALGQARYRRVLDDVVHHRTDPWTAADEVLRGAGILSAEPRRPRAPAKKKARPA